LDSQQASSYASAIADDLSKASGATGLERNIVDHPVKNVLASMLNAKRLHEV
jgi:hypothetical protein